MSIRLIKNTIAFTLALGVLAACGPPNPRPERDPDDFSPNQGGVFAEPGGGSSLFDILRRGESETNVNVNRYIWAASLEVLNFLPVQMVDPFTGVIVTGFGAPPGGGRAYRATVHVRDPALDARSLNLALYSRGGAVSPSTTRAVEDAILSRARQLRIRDRRF